MQNERVSVWKRGGVRKGCRMNRTKRGKVGRTVQNKRATVWKREGVRRGC